MGGHSASALALVFICARVPPDYVFCLLPFECYPRFSVLFAQSPPGFPRSSPATMGSMGIDVSTSEASTPTEQHPPTPAFSQKRSAGDAGLKSNGVRPNKSVKRRASKACQCCRARKVRCNVVEHGAPCTNCRLDEVECIVSESKRKKYVLRQTVSLLLTNL